jgi:hypothetical protein
MPDAISRCTSSISGPLLFSDLYTLALRTMHTHRRHIGPGHIPSLALEPPPNAGNAMAEATAVDPISSLETS